MVQIPDWFAPVLLTSYLVAFLWLGRRAARAAGRNIWLFGTATGLDRLAAEGFRAAFALALIGSFASAAFSPVPLSWQPGAGHLATALAITGLALAFAGGALALAAQITMGASWRVGVQSGASGPLVEAGLFRLSRNPTFLGQLMLLTGIAAASPGLATGAAAALFWLSARAQIASEERVLQRELGEPYREYLRTVPRWFGRAQGQVGAGTGTSLRTAHDTGTANGHRQRQWRPRDDD